MPVRSESSAENNSIKSWMRLNLCQSNWVLNWDCSGAPLPSSSSPPSSTLVQLSDDRYDRHAVSWPNQSQARRTALQMLTDTRRTDFGIVPSQVLHFQLNSSRTRPMKCESERAFLLRFRFASTCAQGCDFFAVIKPTSLQQRQQRRHGRSQMSLCELVGRAHRAN